MTDLEQKKNAKEFAERWKDRGYEKGDTQSFWYDLLEKVLGIENPSEFINFEEQVKNEKNTTDFMDGFIKSTLVLIEQKSINVDLNKEIRQSDGQLLTPYMQARKYIENLPRSKHPKYVITCNFKSFNIYDMEKPNGQPEIIYLDELENDFFRLDFIVNSKSELLKKEEEISKKAGDIIGEIYDAFSNEMNMDIEENQKSLNILCVRLVFCLYAEDAQLFRKNIFYNFLKNSDVNHISSDLKELFKVLNTQERDEFIRRDLLDFPYVNGGLFNEDIRIPYFTEKIYDLLINKACRFDWSKISPTIFGSIFESTLNLETRRNTGIHYTSVENIHKVIDPLFLNSLRDEFYSIKKVRTRKDKRRQLLSFQNKISSLSFLDPACGSGNFLTESYRSLRELENEIIVELIKLEGQNEGQITWGTDENFEPIKVSIQQFYGIEINDFAVKVAKTALWIAEAQMFEKTQLIVVNNQKIDNFLPLESYENIVEGNALRMDWNDVIPNTKCNYIMGNPPFVGTKVMNNSQKEDTKKILGNFEKYGTLDYVACWYVVSAGYIYNTNIQCALVSTNSITQGEQVYSLWKPLLIEKKIVIDFAYNTFIWNSEASLKAHVHCVIIGFSHLNNKPIKYLFDGNMIKKANNINGYLVDAPNIFISNRKNPISDVPSIFNGCKFLDDGNYVLTKEEMMDFVKKDPNTKKFIKKYYGADNFINGNDLYCIWLKNANPIEVKKSPLIMERINKVKNFRLICKSPDTKSYANRPMLPTRMAYYSNNDDVDVLIIPIVSSERRQYLPIDYMSKDAIISYANMIMPNPTLYSFGIIESSVHMSWMRAVAGRLKSDYRYSNTIVYNNFPWPNPTKEQKEKIERTAQMILDARAKYSECSLADLYGENMFLYPELLKAHQENDKAVMEAYGFNWNTMTESDCVAELMKMYQSLIEKK